MNTNAASGTTQPIAVGNAQKTPETTPKTPDQPMTPEEYRAWRATQTEFVTVTVSSDDDAGELDDAGDTGDTGDEGPTFESAEEAAQYGKQLEYAAEREARLAFPHACSAFYESQRAFAAGWNVIPASPITKVPVGLGFKKFTGELTRHINAWETARHLETVEADNVNAALLLDSPTPGCSSVVVDVDNPRDLPLVELWIKSWGIDPFDALQVSTGREGGGVHLYFRRECEPTKIGAYGQHNGAKLFQRDDVVVLDSNRKPLLTPATGLPYLKVGGQVDIKGWRNYVVCPGATHKTGRTYDPSHRGEPVLRLADVINKLPVLPLEAWRETGEPMTRARWAAIEKVYGGPLPAEITDNTNYAACLANPKTPAPLKVEAGREAPAVYRPAHVHAVKIKGAGKGSKSDRYVLPTTHPAYEVFAAIYADKNHPDVTSTGTDTEYGYFCMTRVVPTEGGYTRGANPAGRRKVSRGKTGTGTLIVRDFHAEVTYEFRDNAPAVVVGARPAYLDVQDLGPGAGLWKGTTVPLTVTPEGFLPSDTLDTTGHRFKVLQATQGLGKTELLKARVARALAAGLQVIIVVPTRSLAAEASARYGLPHYEAARGPITGSVVTTNVSLRRVALATPDVFNDNDGALPVGDSIIIVDECEQILQQTHSLGKESEGRAQRSTLMAHVQVAREAYFADADAGALTVQFLTDANIAADTAWYKCNSPHPRTYVWQAGGPEEHRLAVIEDVTAGKRVAAHFMSRDAAVAFHTLACQMLPAGTNILLVTPETIEDGAVDLASINVQARVDLLIYTPAMGTGVSIGLRDWFDRVELFATNRAGDGRQAQQGVMRVRYPKITAIRASGDAATMPTEAEMTPEYWCELYMGREAANEAVIKKLRDSNRVPTDFSGYTPDMNADPVGRQHFRAACVARATAKVHGDGWVTTWLCGAAVFEPRDPHRTDAGKLIGNEMAAIRDVHKDNEATDVAAVPPSTLGYYDVQDLKIPAPVKESLRKAKIYGAAWETASEAARKDIALNGDDDAVFHFAEAFQWSKDDDGKSSVVARDEKDKATTTSARRRHRVLRAAETSALLSCMGVNLHAPADVVLNPDAAVQANTLAERWASANHGLHGDIKQPRNWRDNPMRLVTSLLGGMGVKVDNERKRLPKAQGGGLVREYTVTKAEIERMIALSAHQVLCLHRRDSTYHPGDAATAAEDAALNAEHAKVWAEMEDFINAA